MQSAHRVDRRCCRWRIVFQAFDPDWHCVIAINAQALLLSSDTTRRPSTRASQAAAAVSHEHVVSTAVFRMGNR
jgi:hypothetical protein